MTHTLHIDRESAALEVLFKQSMQSLGSFLENDPHLAIGVSGGADSMALIFLAHHYLFPRGGRVTALTVDHQLRAESAYEAEWVHIQLTQHGIEHHTLVGEPIAPGKNLQQGARNYRYALLTEWCIKNHILHLLTAHHQDDQLETLAMRMLRASSINGMCSMAQIGQRNSIRIVRPLLKISKASLTHYLQTRKIPWLEDPSNENNAFDRVRWRQVLTKSKRPSYWQKGLHTMEKARHWLEIETAKLCVRAITLYPAGYATLCTTTYRTAPEELRLNCLSALIQTIGNKEYPPRLKNLQSLDHNLFHTQESSTTLGHCQFHPAGHQWLICREMAHTLPAATIQDTNGKKLHDGMAWEWQNLPEPCMIGRLGATGVRNLWKTNQPVASAIQQIPAPIRPLLPCIKQANEDIEMVLAVPHIDYKAAICANAGLRCTFRPVKPLAGPPYGCYI